MRRKPHEKITIQNTNLMMRAKKFIGFLRNAYFSGDPATDDVQDLIDAAKL